MTIIEKELESFTKFSHERIVAGRMPQSIDELYDEWRQAHASRDDKLAAGASLRDMEAGETGRDFESIVSDVNYIRDRSLSSFNRTSRQAWWRLPWIQFVLYAVPVGLVLVFVFNWVVDPPTDLNHIVLINRSGGKLEKLIVSVTRSNDSQHVVYSGLCADGSVDVVNWPYAFYGDWVQVSEAGAVRDRIPVNSRGRYGHTLVILIEPEGNVLVEHDRWPVAQVHPL